MERWSIHIKKKVLAILLATGMIVGNLGSLAVRATEVTNGIASEEVPVDKEEDISSEDEKIGEEVEDSTTEISEENTANVIEIVDEKPEVSSSTTEFQGESSLDEHNVNVVDKDGNVTFIDVSEDDTIVASMFADDRALSPQIVGI